MWQVSKTFNTIQIILHLRDNYSVWPIYPISYKWQWQFSCLSIHFTYNNIQTLTFTIWTWEPLRTVTLVASSSRYTSTLVNTWVRIAHKCCKQYGTNIQNVTRRKDTTWQFTNVFICQSITLYWSIVQY